MLYTAVVKRKGVIEKWNVRKDSDDGLRIVCTRGRNSGAGSTNTGYGETAPQKIVVRAGPQI